MSITRSPLNFPAGYRLCDIPLESIFCHKYFGVLMQDKLEWDSHVKSVKHKAKKILGLWGRNFSGSSQYVKTQAYNSLVRPHVEYASAAWSPFEKQRIKALETVQCCAIRFVCSDYSQFSSVTSMQHSLGWDTLEVRRHLNTATIMYKAVHNWTHLTFPASVILAHRRGSEWGGPLVGCRLKFSNFVGSRLKFSIFVGSRLNFSIFAGCRKISVNE